MWNYISTIYQSYYISSSTIGRIKFENIINEYLLIGRQNILQIYECNHNDKMHLKAIKDITLYGEILYIKRICPLNQQKQQQSDVFFILINSLDYCFCSLDDGHLSIVHKGTIFQIVPSSSLIETSVSQISPIGANLMHNDYSNTEIKVISNLDLMNINADIEVSYNQYYLLISIHHNLSYIIIFKYDDKDHLIIIRNNHINFKYEHIIDMIPLNINQNIYSNLIPKMLSSSSLSLMTYNYTIGILSINLKNQNVFETIDINLIDDKMSINKTSWKIIFNPKNFIYKIIGLSDSSLIAFSENGISLYRSRANEPTFELNCSIKVNAIDRISHLNDHFIISDHQNGGLYLLSFNQNPNFLSKNDKSIKTMEVTSKFNHDRLTLNFLGKSSIASILIHTKDLYFFIGSQLDDSKLLKLCYDFTGDINNPYIEVIDSLNNLGFISNFELIQRMGNSKSLLIVNEFKNENQINVLNNGLKLKIDLDLSNLNNEWFTNAIGLYNINAEIFNKNYIIICKTFASCIFSITNTKADNKHIVLNQLDIKNLNQKSKIIHIKEIDQTNFIYINQHEINLIAINAIDNANNMQEEELSQIDTVKINESNNNHNIVLADSYYENFVIGCNKDLLQSYMINQKKIIKLASKHVEHQISALTLNNDYVIVAFWGLSLIQIYHRHNLLELSSINLHNSGIVSIKLAELSPSSKFILCGLYDGTLSCIELTDSINDNLIVINKQSNYALGLTPLNLQLITYLNQKYVFIGCDTPAVLHLSNSDSISIADVLANNITHMYKITLNKKEQLLLLIQNTISIGTLETNNNILIRSLPFQKKEHVKFVSHISDLNIYLIGANSSYDYLIERHAYIDIYDIQSLKLIISVKIENMAILIMKIIKIQDKVYALVGGKCLSRKKGFFIIYMVKNDGLIKIQEKFYDKYVRDCDMLMNEYVVLGHDSTIRILKIKHQDRLQFLDNIPNEKGINPIIQDSITVEEALVENIDAVDLRINCFDNMIFYIDNLKGIGLYLYMADENKLLKIYSSMKNVIDNGMGYIINENDLIIACGNTLKMIKKSLNQEKYDFQTVAAINLNDTITCIKKQKFNIYNLDDQKEIMQANKSSILPIDPLDCIIYGTLKGNIGMIVLLPQKAFHLLNNIQQYILNEINKPNTFGSEYNNWRSHMDIQLNGKIESSGFIDGDILKNYLNYPRMKMEEILNNTLFSNDIQIDDIIQLLQKLNKII